MSAVPALRTWAPGEVATAVSLNSEIRSTANFFKNPPMCLLTLQGSNLSIPNNAWTIIPWNAVLVDTDNHHNTAGGQNTRINVIRPGIYDIRIGALFASATDSGGRGISIDRTAQGGGKTAILRGGQFNCRSDPGGGQPSPSSGETSVQAVDHGIYLAAGDVLEIVVFQNSGGALNLLATNGDNPFTSFAMRWIAAV